MGSFYNKMPLDPPLKDLYSRDDSKGREQMGLYEITYAINFIALMAAFWLGSYLVTRNPRTPTAWLTAFTLWSLGGLFLNILLALNPPPVPAYRPSGMRILFPFWASGTFEKGANAWLQGWSVAPAVAFWHHATMLMRPGRMNAWRWTRVLAGYVMAFAATELQAFTQILFSVEGGNPLYLNSLRAGPLYSIFTLTLIILTATSTVNLARSARAAPSEITRRQLQTLTIATIIAGLVGPLSLVASGFNLFPVPMAALSTVMLVFVGIVGYGVARYSALVEGRTIRHDFVYNMILIMSITIIYLLASRTLVLAYMAPTVIALFIPTLAIFTHSAMNVIPRLLDILFYRNETRRLRSNLRQLSRLTGEGESLKENLDATLNALCTSVRASYGLILAFEGETARTISDCRWRGYPVEVPAATVSADDVVHISANQFPAPLDDIALLVPLYAESEQVGALLLCQPSNGVQYADIEVERVLHPADRISDAINSARRRNEYISRLTEVVEEHRASNLRELQSIPAEIVENALRNLYDYTYLSDSPLAGLDLVQNKLAGKKTHLERGKVVHGLLLGALEEMRPGDEIPRDPPPRVWYPYLILKNAYQDELSNRDIMLKLYISEGTFNRTRRAAIRSLARELTEMANQ